MSGVNLSKLNSLTKDIKEALDFGKYENKEIPKKNGFFKNIFAGFGAKSYLKEVRNNMSIRNKDKYNTEALSNYLSKGGNPNLKNNSGVPILANVRTLKEMSLILAHGGDVNARDKQGKTVLEILAQDKIGPNFGINNVNNIEKMVLLLKNGANLEKNLGKDILNAALKNNQNEMLLSLVQTIAETNPKFIRNYAKETGKDINALNDSLKTNIDKEWIVPEVIVESNENDNKSELSKNKENIVDEKIDNEVAQRVEKLLESNKNAMPFEEFKKKLSSSNSENSAMIKYEYFLESESKNKKNTVENDSTFDVSKPMDNAMHDSFRWGR